MSKNPTPAPAAVKPLEGNGLTFVTVAWAVVGLVSIQAVLGIVSAIGYKDQMSTLHTAMGGLTILGCVALAVLSRTLPEDMDSRKGLFIYTVAMVVTALAQFALGKLGIAGVHSALGMTMVALAFPLAPFAKLALTQQRSRLPEGRREFLD